MQAIPLLQTAGVRCFLFNVSYMHKNQSSWTPHKHNDSDSGGFASDPCFWNVSVFLLQQAFKIKAVGPPHKHKPLSFWRLHPEPLFLWVLVPNTDQGLCPWTPLWEFHPQTPWWTTAPKLQFLTLALVGMVVVVVADMIFAVALTSDVCRCYW